MKFIRKINMHNKGQFTPLLCCFITSYFITSFLNSCNKINEEKFFNKNINYNLSYQKAYPSCSIYDVKIKQNKNKLN